MIRSKEVYDKYGIRYKVIELWGAGGITTITDSKMVSDILNQKTTYHDRFDDVDYSDYIIYGL